ncbi:MAG: HU family DNA-binding protein [Gammaproteobacteria bacterium]
MQHNQAFALAPLSSKDVKDYSSAISIYIHMNTTDLIQQLSEQLNISKAEARRMLQQELSALGQQLTEGKHVIIRGFGTLGLRNIRPSKTNPNPGQTVFFRASQKLRAIIRPWKP